jgi:Flp pilus assembly protein TadG
MEGLRISSHNNPYTENLASLPLKSCLKVPAFLSRPTMRFLRSLRDESGVSAVEFALIAPVLIFLLLGLMEGGLLIHTWGNMEYVARQAARGAAIGEFTRQQAQDFIVDQMQKSVGAPVATASVRFVSGARPVDNEVIVDVTVPAAQLARIQPVGIFRMMSLSAQVTMHQELDS